MSTINEIRTELAALAPEGYQGYNNLPSNAQLPALVVDLPDEITLDATFRYATIQFKVVVVSGAAFGPETELRLTTDVVSIAKNYAGISGTSFRSCMVESINEFYQLTVGSKEALSASINLKVIAEL